MLAFCIAAFLRDFSITQYAVHISDFFLAFTNFISVGLLKTVILFTLETCFKETKSADLD